MTETDVPELSLTNSDLCQMVSLIQLWLGDSMFRLASAWVSFSSPKKYEANFS